LTRCSLKGISRGLGLFYPDKNGLAGGSQERPRRGFTLGSMPLFADQLETCRDIAKRWVIPGSRFCHACRLGRRYRLICGAGIGTRVRGLPIGVNFKGAGVGRPLTGEGARPRAPQRRAKLTDVFRPLDRQTRSASGTIPRPRDGDVIPLSAGSGSRRGSAFG